MNKKVSVSLLVTVCVIVVAVTFSITMVVSMRIFDKTVADVQEKEQMYDSLAELDTYVRETDYYTADETTLNNMLASGYVVGSGDKNAKYYTADAYSEYVQIANGKLVGIGTLTVKDSATGYAKIIKVYAGSPAEELGITAGCYITAIDGTEVKSLTLDAVQSRLRGESGTATEIVWLDSALEEHTDTVTRRSYAVTTVEYSMADSSCGYIRIRDFTDDTASELDYAVNYVTTQGAQAIIFDLRDNTCTSLDAAIDCVSLICPSGVVASSEDSAGSVTVLGRSTDKKSTDLSLVCLVNGSTAGGAELFAADLRSMKGARLAGTTTAGRGMLMSDPKMFSDGSAVVLTVAKLLANDGTAFDGTGLAVDTECALSEDEQTVYYDFTVDTDPQVQRALQVADAMTGNTSAAAAAESAAESEAAEGETAEETASEEPAESEEAESEAESESESESSSQG